MLKHVYGTKERIFVNTTIGCSAACKYCYLPKIKKNADIIRVSPQKIYEEVSNMKEFIAGKNNTIVSLGCYSDCFAEENISDTLELIRYFCKSENYIQVSSKQIVTREICESITASRFFGDQVSVYISIPTCSRISDVEPGTATLEDRIKNIRLCKEYGINVVLYIKPFLNMITSHDINKYVQIVSDNEIPIVVGDYLNINRTKKMAYIGQNMLFEEESTSEMKDFYSRVSQYTNVYHHSTDYIEYLRGGL